MNEDTHAASELLQNVKSWHDTATIRAYLQSGGDRSNRRAMFSETTL
jgi:hypothetical protein